MKGAPRPAAWRGALELGDAWAVWRGAVGDAAVHRHFAAQAVLASEPVTVVDGSGGGASARCVLVEPLAPHRLAPSPDVTLLFVEPSRRPAAGLAERLRPVREARSLALVSSPAATFWLAWLGRAPSAGAALDPRLDAALAGIDRALGDGPASLRRIADGAGLSPDRFRHLFAEQVGIPFRRYVLWRRLRLAAAGLAGGADVTEAAHAAGFADAAHLARTLKANFGVTATQAFGARRR